MTSLPNLSWKILELSFWVLQLLKITHLYEWSARQLKTHRPLNQNERFLAKYIYGESIDLDKVRIDEHAKFGPKQYHLCYVSFNIINSWGRMRDDILIHELVHVWQYQHFGAAYIPRALWAQRTPEAYDYGGVEALLIAKQNGQKFWEFNYEQQGDIVSDYFRISQGWTARWGNATEKDLAVYEYFLEQMRNFDRTKNRL
ncbi:MAG: hypothetical protein AAF849_10855 [Bacteroidota bacterium]